MERVIRTWGTFATQSRSGRLLLLVVLCAVPPGVEAALVRQSGLTATVNISPQASALWPYGTFHDLRWVLVYHRSWAGFVGESIAAIVMRGLFCTVLIALAWPSNMPRPSLPRLAARNVGFAALVGAVLSPWAALSVVVAAVSLTWFLFGEIAPMLILAPFLQRGGIVRGWWRGLPPAGTVALSVLNFVTLTAGSALVAVVPGGWRIAAAALAGGANGILWERAVRIVLAHETVRWRRTPITPIAFAVVIGPMFTIGSIARPGIDQSPSEPPALAKVEARTKRPVIFLAGYDSHYGGQPSGFTPPIMRYSYNGLDPNGRPRPYNALATHQSLVTSAQLLAVQVDQVHRRTGQKVALLADSEGTLITRYYLTTMPHPHIDMVVMVSPLLRSGRIYYPPPQANTGWGIATGWQLRAIFAALGAVGDRPNSPDQPFIRSFMDNAPLFRGKQVICPIEGVQMIAFVPTLDAATNPPGLQTETPVVHVPGLHGLRLNDPVTQQRVISFLNDGQRHEHRRWDYSVLQRAGGAWQAPALKVALNPVWHTVAGRSTRNYEADVCLQP
ncbi:esterase/lipase family protein [Micromonospora inositola]|uniref:esterase/lipase family protein n=1 Tax=Micromonospora inositola TaxID=47865 RepID=UPI000B5ACB59|nr:hypothetical protein [Micromonospora inositola]